MVQSDLPFIATAALLALWGTGRNDSNVAFFSAIFVLSYVIVAGLSQTAVNNAVTLPGEAIPQTDVFSQYFADHPNSLSTFLMMMFCFGFGAVGTTVFAFSPFAGEVLYAAVVSALFRDVSIVGDARVIVWACVIVSGALSEHVFRLNLAALCLGLMFWERGIIFPQRGALESLCLVNGVIILTIHDIVVRFFLDPIKALIEAGFLAMTAFVMVDSAIELGALPSTVGQTQKPNITGVANLMNIRWTDCLEVRSYPFNEDFPK
ncbi:MAG TPA: hypothetical protein VEF04_15255, partial [Blastocatellia bacterium]|nr:hypothetical protein [Blastocatellia bacterium]